MIHLLHGRGIDRYFAGARDAAAMGAMFARVGSCDACRRRYERHLLYERVLPDDPARAARRLWQSIEATVGAPKRARVTPARATFFVAATACAALLVWARPHTAEVSAPVVRGSADPAAAAAAPTLHLYKNAGGRAVPVGGALRPDDGLLLAYSNPTDLGYLMVFAVDEKAGVHWYYPPYVRQGDDPVSVAIRPRALGVELGEEIRHALPAGRLTMIALFLPSPRRVLEVERAVAEALARGGGDAAALGGLAGPGAVEVTMPLEVSP